MPKKHIEQFDRYGTEPHIKQTSMFDALKNLHGLLGKPTDFVKEHAYGAFLMYGREYYLAMRSYLKNNPLCHKCDGHGFTVKSDYNRDGSDEYFDCDCGQGANATTITGEVKPLTSMENAYIEMHKVLQGMVNEPGFDQLDTTWQDKITAAAKAGEKWL